MTIVRHELRQGRNPWMIWTASVGFLLAVCIFLFPDMKGEMKDVSQAFSSMGSFTSAFGMDRLNFGSLTGYYAIECGNVLGLGGAFFAALCAAGILSREEREHTAEFLLAHPVSRTRVVAEKLAAVGIQIAAMDLFLYLLAAASIRLIGEDIPWKELNLLHLSYFILHLELAGICFGVSAFQRKGSAGTGLGITVILYFLNLIANITESASLLKHITPFGYCDSADIISAGRLDTGMVLTGIAIGAAGILAAFLYYRKKDIH